MEAIKSKIREETIKFGPGDDVVRNASRVTYY
jgi:hypothetical protein